MTGLAPAPDAITQREAVRAYVLAANLMEGRADAYLSVMDIESWEVCLSWAERLRRVAEIEEREPAGWSVAP